MLNTEQLEDLIESKFLSYVFLFQHSLIIPALLTYYLGMYLSSHSFPPLVSKDTEILLYTVLIFLSALVFYDAIINMDREVELIWKERFRSSTVLYIMSRYFVLPCCIFCVAAHSGMPQVRMPTSYSSRANVDLSVSDTYVFSIGLNVFDILRIVVMRPYDQPWFS